MDRRTLLYAIGAISISPLLTAPALGDSKKVALSMPGESRFSYANPHQAKLSPCKLISDDTNGMLSMFELNVGAKAGPVRHIHRREDEWSYVTAGEFVFEIGSDKFTLPVGGSIWMPRDIPHVWANVSAADGRLIVSCQPGGFEKFFDALGNIPKADDNQAHIKKSMADFGMDLVGPPLYGIWRQN